MSSVGSAAWMAPTIAGAFAAPDNATSFGHGDLARAVAALVALGQLCAFVRVVVDSRRQALGIVPKLRGRSATDRSC